MVGLEKAELLKKRKELQIRHGTEKMNEDVEKEMMTATRVENNSFAREHEYEVESVSGQDLVLELKNVQIVDWKIHLDPLSPILNCIIWCKQCEMAISWLELSSSEIPGGEIMELYFQVITIAGNPLADC